MSHTKNMMLFLCLALSIVTAHFMAHVGGNFPEKKFLYHFLSKHIFSRIVHYLLWQVLVIQSNKFLRFFFSGKPPPSFFFKGKEKYSVCRQKINAGSDAVVNMCISYCSGFLYIYKHKNIFTICRMREAGVFHTFYCRHSNAIFSHPNAHFKRSTCAE